MIDSLLSNEAFEASFNEATNCEGLTLEEWANAAGLLPTDSCVREAWLDGEDPTEWR